MRMTKTKKKTAVTQSIVFPPDLKKRIVADAKAARRSFSGQVLFLLDIALKEAGE